MYLLLLFLWLVSPYVVAAMVTEGSSPSSTAIPHLHLQSRHFQVSVHTIHPTCLQSPSWCFQVHYLHTSMVQWSSSRIPKPLRSSFCHCLIYFPLRWSPTITSKLLRSPTHQVFIWQSWYISCINVIYCPDTFCSLMHLNMSSLGTLSKSNQCRSTVFPTLYISPSLLRKSIFVSSSFNFHHMILRLPFSFLLAVIFTITVQT